MDVIIHSQKNQPNSHILKIQVSCWERRISKMIQSLMAIIVIWSTGSVPIGDARELASRWIYQKALLQLNVKNYRVLSEQLSDQVLGVLISDKNVSLLKIDNFKKKIKEENTNDIYIVGHADRVAHSRYLNIRPNFTSDQLEDAVDDSVGTHRFFITTCFAGAAIGLDLVKQKKGAICFIASSFENSPASGCGFTENNKKISLIDWIGAGFVDQSTFYKISNTRDSIHYSSDRAFLDPDCWNETSFLPQSIKSALQSRLRRYINLIHLTERHDLESLILSMINKSLFTDLLQRECIELIGLLERCELKINKN